MFFLDYSLFIFSLLSLFLFFLNRILFLRLGIYTHTHTLSEQALLCFLAFCFHLSLCPDLFPFGSPYLSFPHKHTLHTLRIWCLDFVCSIFSVLVSKGISKGMISLRRVLGGLSHRGQGWIQPPTRPEPSITH